MGTKDRAESVSIEPGELLYDGDNELVGRVSGVTDEGFEAEAVTPEESEVEEMPGKEFGEGYLMWRCEECGEMDELDDGLPDSCPNCDAPKEALSAVTED
jgi:rubrerythrin